MRNDLQTQVTAVVVRFLHEVRHFTLAEIGRMMGLSRGYVSRVAKMKFDVEEIHVPKFTSANVDLHTVSSRYQRGGEGSGLQS